MAGIVYEPDQNPPNYITAINTFMLLLFICLFMALFRPTVVGSIRTLLKFVPEPA